MKFLVINGPNINMLGRRQPDIYGRRTYSELVEYIERRAKENGVEIDCYQSNHEGDLVDKIQEACDAYDGIVINAGAYTHTSIAIADALAATLIPAIEVHISDVARRESFRQVSYIRQICLSTYSGMGFEGYEKAIIFLKNHLTNS